MGGFWGNFKRKVSPPLSLEQQKKRREKKIFFVRQSKAKTEYETRR
jgi:hypothetical protein